MYEFSEVVRPYPGLRPFEPWEAEIFFGREAHIDRLQEVLQRERFLAIVGPSGSGKSSLVRAGLLPALPLNAIGSGSDWRIAIIRPGHRPLRRLAQALLAPEVLGRELLGLAEDAELTVTASDVALIEAELRRGPRGLVHLLKDARRSAQDPEFNLLILVDQFEEIFTYAEAGQGEANEADALVNLMLESRGRSDAAHGEQRLFVALTMRTDFLGECTRFLDLPEAINHAQFLTPRLNRLELEQAITGPARLRGGQIDASLVQELINAAGRDPDQLPVLQDALARMWDLASARDKRRPMLTWADHDAIGGLGAALDQHAEEVYLSLPEAGRGAAEVLFRAITKPNGDQARRAVREPHRLAWIGMWSERDWRDFLPVLTAFSAEGVNFLQCAQPWGPDAVVDISHEALIRQWRRLGLWVASEARRAATYQRLRERFEEHRRGDGSLLTGSQLSRAVEWSQALESSVRRLDITHFWQPGAAWAERYRLPDSSKDEFQQVMAFVNASREAELAQQEAKRQEDIERQQQAQALRDAEQASQAQAERLQVEAKARQQAQQLAARLSRMTGFMALALIGAVILGVLGWRANRQAHEAVHESEILRLAAQGQALVAEGRQGKDLQRGIYSLLAAYRMGESEQVWAGLQQASLRQSGVQLLLDLGARQSALAYSPDSHVVVTAAEDGKLVLRDARSGVQLLPAISAHDGAVQSVAFSSDGRRLLTAGKDGSIRLWDARNGAALSTVFQGAALFGAAFSPDGQRIASAGADGLIRVWLPGPGAPVERVLGRHQGPAYAVQFSADGQRVFSSGEDGSRMWSVNGGDPVLLRDGRSTEATTQEYALAVSSDGKLAATGGAGQIVRVWDQQSGRLIATPIAHQGGPIAAVAFTSDGRFLAVATLDHAIRVVDLRNSGALPVMLSGHTRTIAGLNFSPDGLALASTGSDGSLRIWRRGSGYADTDVLDAHHGPVLSLAISPDNAVVASAGSDGLVHRWRVAERSEILPPLSGHGGTVNMVRFSRDGSQLITAGEDQTVRLWDARSGAEVERIQADEILYAALFSPDGRQLAYAGRNGVVHLRQLADGTEKLLNGHVGPIFHLAYSPDGRLLVSGGKDRSLRLWDTARAAAVGQPWEGHGDTVFGVNFSHDGSRVVSASLDMSLRQWQVSTGQPIGKPLLGHTDGVMSARYSPDDQHLISGSLDGTVRVWEVASGAPAGQPFLGHKDGVYSVGVAGSNDMIASASQDGTVRLWPVFRGWVDILCAKLPRNMTRAEWLEWVGPGLSYVRQCPNLPESD